MTRYWHVAHPMWQPGQPLCSRNSLVAEDIYIPWLWDEAPEGTDCDLVCLFPDTAQGRLEAQWLIEDRPEYSLVCVELPENIEVTRAEWEDYPAVRDSIPSGYLALVESLWSTNA